MWHSALATILLISQATAGVISDTASLVRRDAAEELIKRYVENIVEPIEKRQAPTVLNVTQWDEQTSAACTSTLEGLNGVASNPAGLAVCYNLPMLDSTTGVFQADLRIFKISEPTGTFANVAAQNVQVGLSYIGATVSNMNQSTMNRRSEGESLISWPRNTEKRQQAVVPVLEQAFSLVGRINQDLLTANMGTNDLQKVLVPTITLTGTDSSGNVVNTTLSSQEATFVSGIFAVQTTPTRANVDIPLQTLVTAKDQPFVVPGLNIMIFPIGAIITGLWATLFITTIGYGTYGRMQFRDSFRRRKKAEKGNFARI